MSTLFKKVTASVAALSIVLSIVSPVTGAQASTSSDIDAANRLAALGIIADNSKNPTAYNLGSSITRREMLKIMINLSSVELTDTCEGKFADLKASDWGCKYAEAALKAGFIAANTNFRPDDLVSKSEALKMIMQAKGLAKKDGVEPWQKAYVEAGLEEGVITESFSDYTASAKRAMVVVVADTVSSSEDDMASDDDFNIDDLFGGITGDDDTTGTVSTGTTSTGTVSSTGTTSTGTTVIVATGDLDISLNPASAANGTQIPRIGSIKFAAVDLTAGQSDVSVNSIELKSLGLAAVDSSTRIWFEKNGKRLSGKASFSSNRVAVTSFAPAYVVKAGSTETLDLYVELSTTAGNDYQFSGKVTSSSAANVKGTFNTNTLRTADYTVAPVAFSNEGSGLSVTQTSEAVELGRFALTNNDISSETRDVKFQTITLRQNGNGDLVDLSDIMLERNGVKVSTEAMISGKDVTFVLNDIIKDGGTKATYYIRAKVVNVQNNLGDAYQFSLRNDTDLNAVEVLNGFRSTVTGKTTLNTYSVTGADITFARDSSVELSRTYAKGSSDVVFLQGTITSKTAITVEDPTISFTSTAVANQLFDTLYLQIGSSVMTWSANGTKTAQFSGLANVNGTTTVKLYAKLKDSASSVNVKFDDLRLSTFTLNGKVEYVSNQNEVSSSVGSIPGVQVTVGSTILSITRIDGLGNTTVAVGSKAVLANELSLLVTQGNSVNISNATYTVAATGDYTNNVFATLYVDGVAVSTKTVNGATVTFNNLSKLVSSTAVKMSVKIDLSDAYTAGNFSMRLTGLDAVDSTTSATVSSTAPTSATLSIASAIGTLSTSDANPKASLLLAGSKDVKVLAFRVKATNDTVKLRDVKFTGTSLDKLSNFRILTPDSKYLVATSNSASAVDFTNISDTNNYSIVMDKTETFYVVADLNTNVNTVSNLSITLDASESQIKSTNGTLSTLVGSDVASNVHAIEENTAVVAKDTNSSKDLNTSALRFTVTASGKDSVTLNSATFDNLFSGYTGTSRTTKAFASGATIDAGSVSMVGTASGSVAGSGGVVATYESAAKLVVYKDSISSSNKLGEIAVGSGSTVTFNQMNTVDAGSTNKYIVAIEGALIDSNANTPSWTIRMNNLRINSINASTYDNMGQFPITETR